LESSLQERDCFFAFPAFDCDAIVLAEVAGLRLPKSDIQTPTTVEKLEPKTHQKQKVNLTPYRRTWHF